MQLMKLSEENVTLWADHNKLKEEYADHVEYFGDLPRVEKLKEASPVDPAKDADPVTQGLNISNLKQALKMDL